MPLREIINIQAASAASKPAVFTANQPNNGPPDGGSNQSVPSRENSNVLNSGKCFFFKFLNVSLGRVCGDFCAEPKALEALAGLWKSPKFVRVVFASYSRNFRCFN